jgi:sulfur dioxygenase
MNNLNLPNPKLMDVAVPANRACGDERILKRA